MIKLYGYPLSNYYNMVLIALLEKGFDYQEVFQRPSQEADYLKLSPMGKIPCMEVREGSLSESMAMLEFLEDIQPDIPLMPKDPYQKAKCRELMWMAELYIDLPVRKVVLANLMKKDVAEGEMEQAVADAKRGFSALTRLTDFTPYLLGETFSCADIVLYGAMAMSEALVKMVDNWCPLEEIGELSEWYGRVSQRHSVRTADEGYQKAMAEFLARFEDQ